MPPHLASCLAVQVAGYVPLMEETPRIITVIRIGGVGGVYVCCIVSLAAAPEASPATGGRRGDLAEEMALQDQKG